MLINKIPRAEHPDPMCVRDSWHNLNGVWECAIDNEKQLDKDSVFPLKINVPFSPESRLSGIGITDFIERLWYRRHINLNTHHNMRTILRFGACDYKTQVWVNGIPFPVHIGGQSSFSYDITDAIRNGDNVLTVCADDDTRSDKQPSGKQSMKRESHGCFYTRTTGIWQTVWLEFVPEKYIRSWKFYPNAENGTLTVTADADDEVSIEIYWNWRYCGGAKFKDKTVIELSEKHLWELGVGGVYNVVMRCGADKVMTYFGLRSTGFKDGKYYFNNRPLFMRTVLDQGYYPDGIYTAPYREALENDIKLSLSCGFNGARLHQKVFEPMFLYYCDLNGYIVWGEYPSWGVSAGDGDAFDIYINEWKQVLDRDHNHPSIIGWCPLNETMFDKLNDVNSNQTHASTLSRLYEFTKSVDPTRPCIDASGGVHIVTDCYDVHDYEQDPVVYAKKHGPFANGAPLSDNYGDRQKHDGALPVFVSEYGGTAVNPDKSSWGYGNSANTPEELVERFTALTEVLMRNKRICGLCYTQLYDIEQECNGIFTYDRVPKADPSLFKAVLDKKAAIEE